MDHDTQQVLQAIYPELAVRAGTLSIPVRLVPGRSVTFVCDGDEFATEMLALLQFSASVPLRPDGFALDCCWMTPRVLRTVRELVNSVIRSSHHDEVYYSVLELLTTGLLDQHELQLFGSYRIPLASRHQFAQVVQTSTALKTELFNSSRFSCPICLEDHYGCDCVELPGCGHVFCARCLTQYLTSTIDSDVSKLQCPNCPTVVVKELFKKTQAQLKQIYLTDTISLDVLRKLLPAHKVQKYQHLKNELFFEKFQHYFPFSVSNCPRCAKWLLRDDVDDNLMRCDGCELAYCYQCNHSWHGTTNSCGKKMNVVPVEVIEEVLELPDDSSTKLNYIQKYGKKNMSLAISEYKSDLLFKEIVENNNDIKKCPSCGTVISKSDGCNKMKCPVCSCLFCYICELDLVKTDPYAHFTDYKSSCYGLLFQGMEGVED